MTGKKYKIRGIAQDETIRYKRDLWTFIVQSLRMKKESLRHLVQTVSIWVAQVMLEMKCTPRYFIVCSRDKASPLMKEGGSWEEVLSLR